MSSTDSTGSADSTSSTGGTGSMNQAGAALHAGHTGHRDSRRILVVDDEPEVRAAVEDGLAVEGYEVRGAADGLAALSQVAAWEPDAVVLDVMMPVLDGLAVCRRAARDGRPYARPRPDRARLRQRARRRTGGGGRRLPRQAVRPGRAGRPRPGAAAAGRARAHAAPPRSASPTSSSTPRPGPGAGADGHWSSAVPKRPCSSCSYATPARCSRAS